MRGWRHLVMIAVLAVTLFPVGFVAVAAFVPMGTLDSSLMLSHGFTLANFTGLLSGHTVPFGRWVLNSLLLTTLSVLASSALSLCAAYAFSRMRFRGRRTGLASLLLIQMFPQFLAIIAIISMFTAVNRDWPAFGFNTIWGLFLLYLGGALGMNTYLMKGFLDSVPRDLDQAAVIDGASHLQVFLKVIVPLARPVIAVAGILAFIGILSEFIMAGLFLQSPGSQTLAVGMYQMFSQSGTSGDFGMFTAATLLTSVPTVVIFLWAQRYIVSGLTYGAVKG